MKFTEFPKIPRLRREVVVTEKIDGTNASIWIEDHQAMQYSDLDDPGMPWLQRDYNGYAVAVGSRTRWITPTNDNHGFARWVSEHLKELVPALGPGHHFGEWWGSGIQRGYGLLKGEKRFSLFNTHRWHSEFNNIGVNLWNRNGGVDDGTFADYSTRCIELPICHVVPIIASGIFESMLVEFSLTTLRKLGSVASPKFPNPEGVVIYHTASSSYYKQTLEKDDQPKGAKL